MRAFLDDPAHGAGRFRADSGAAGARDRRQRTGDAARQLRGRARPRLAGARVHRHLPRPPRGERDGSSTARSGTARRPEPEVSVEEGIRERFQIDVGDTMRFDILGRIINARVTSIREVDWRDSRSGGFMFVFRPGRARAGAADVHRAAEGPGRRRGAGQVPARARPAVSERVGHRLPRDPRRRSATSMSKVTLAITRRRRPRAVQRRADPDRRRRDDQVPARLRGGGLQDAGREHAHHRPDAAVRVRRARPARRRWSARWARWR